MVNLRKAAQQGKQPAAGAGTLSEELQSSSQADDAAHMVAQVLFLSHGKSFLTHTSSGRSFWSCITGWVHDQCQARQSAGHQCEAGTAGSMRVSLLHCTLIGVARAWLHLAPICIPL